MPAALRRGSGLAAGGACTWLRSVSCALLLLAAASPGRAQMPELPTLAGMGLEYISRTGFFQVSLSGQLDLEALHIVNDWESPPADGTVCDACHVDVGRAFREGEGTIQAYRLRIFADLFLGDHVYSLIEVRGDRGRETFGGATRGRLDQAFVRFSTASGAAGAQVGRFASPFGSYALRHLSVIDPFVTPPLLYDYRTVANRWRVPGSAEAFLRWKDAPHEVDFPGAPPIWEVPYQWGGMIFGRFGPLDLRAAAMNSAPSSQPNAWKLEWSRFERPSWVLAARWKPATSVELGLSYDRGPWMGAPTAGTILPPPGAQPGTPAPGWRSFDQEIVAADVGFARGATMIRAEAILDRWQVPNVSDTPTELGFTVEAQRDLAAGLFAAVRAGRLDFRPIEDGLGAASPYPGGRTDWDHDVSRYEASLGYRLTRNAGLILSGYQQIQDGGVDGDTRFVGLRLWWGF